MGEIVGKYLQRKKKEHGLTNKQIADFLNITVSAVEKMYTNDEIYASRLAKLSALFGENLVEDYYYRQEPLRSMSQKVIDEWNQKIDALKATIANQKTSINQLRDHIKTQNDYIALLEKEVKRLEAALEEME
ncbi:MAG TPA: hypothetical protein VK017_09600 [Sphingobacterium sp.]|nr:hypothetical protein [Sphingobacterium sp.]